MARQSLGRGFDALIPKELDKAILAEDSLRIQKLLIEDIKPNRGQPRQDFDDESITELATSIKRHGVLQPIIVVRSEGGSGYIIVAGERRWRAAKSAGLTHIPSIVRSLKELERIELSLIENIQRVDLSPMEQAMSLYKLQHQFSMSIDEIAKKLGKATSTVSNLIRLLNLPDATRDALNEGKISEGHARAILALKNNPALQNELLNSIINNGWTVRQAEQFVKDARGGVLKFKPDELTAKQNEFLASMDSRLGLPVAIKRGVRGGRIIIKFKSDEQLQNILEKFNR